MPNNAKLFLNKVINENDVKALVRHDVDLAHMPNEIDRKAYQFIERYSKENGGDSPSYATVADNVDGFEYIPEISDSYAYLAKNVKAYHAKRRMVELLNDGDFEKKIRSMDGHEFIEEWLPSVIDDIRRESSLNTKVGTDLKSGADDFIAEFDKRLIGESGRMWKSRFSCIGEYVSGNMYTIFGESGRGKSVIALEDAIYAAMQGANVLIWSLEMPLYEVMSRAYISISGSVGVRREFVEGVDMDVGFDADDLRKGTFNHGYEAAFKTFVRNINEYVPGNITIRAIDDSSFIDKNLRALEHDIEATNADFVVVDPFYFMDYEANTSRTKGGDASNTSRAMRLMTGRLDVVMIPLTQAEESKPEFNDDGVRTLNPPTRETVKKTKSLLEDAAILISVDTNYKQGLGIVRNNKGRSGGEDNVSNIIYLPQYGVVEEISVGDGAMEGFEF